MDVETLAIAIGLIVSFAFTEIFGLAAGGMVVPGYLALELNRPANILLTLLAAVATFLIVRGIAHLAIVYGRRRIVLMLLVGFLVGTLMRAGLALAFGEEHAVSAHALTAPTVIGFIVPGLIALWIDRQGMLQTVSVLATSSVVVRLVLILAGIEVLA